MNNFLKLPFYARVSLLLVGLYVLINMLYIAGSLIIPFVYAVIIAVLLSPSVNFLVNKKVNRALAIAIVMFVVMLLLAGLMLLISSQASRLNEAMPQLTQKFNELDSWDRSDKNKTKTPSWPHNHSSKMNCLHQSELLHYPKPKHLLDEKTY